MPPGDWSKTTQVEVIFHTSRALLLTVFLVSMVPALRGNQVAEYFLWVQAALMILALLLMNRTNMISYIAADLMLVLFLYMLYTTVRYEMERVDVSHEETRRILAESNWRIDEERCTFVRCLHNEVNPQLLLMRNVLKQLELLVAENRWAAELLGNASGILNDAYTEVHDIIKNTRTEVIDPIGFTAASELLVAYYTNTPEKSVTTLEHDLSKRSAMSEASAVSTYKIIREVIFNVIKHSKAAQVRVSIHYNKALDTYKMEITDDGVGVKAMARNGEHADIGLIDMRERVQVFGGALEIQAVDPTNRK